MKNLLNTPGLQILKEDKRDYSLAGFFGQIDIVEVPNVSFNVSTPIRIKDQGETDFCSAYAVTGVSEDQEDIELVPQYQFFKTKQISGDPEAWGADLRSACKSATKFGSLALPDIEGMEGILGSPYLMSREDVLDKNNWPPYIDVLALKNRKETYFPVDGRYDVFDNIRTALWQHRSERRSIVVGASWKEEWITALNGVIPEGNFQGGFGHAFKIYGQKVMEDGEIRLVAQLSNGSSIGDGGKFYFSRNVVNKELAPYGQFMFKDVTRESVDAKISESKVSWYAAIIDNIISLIKR